MNRTIEDARVHITQIGRMLFERRLTDAAGGNISVRVDDLICMSPSYSGSKRHWDLDPDEVLVVDSERRIVEGRGKISRETNVHFALHERYAEAGTAVIHAHPRNLLVFAALERPMPPVLEANMKFGEVACVAYAPAHSQELAMNVARGLRGQEARIAKHAAGVIAPWHGLFLMGKDLNAAFDAVERFDTNASIILSARSAGMEQELDAKSRTLHEHERALSRAD